MTDLSNLGNQGNNPGNGNFIDLSKLRDDNDVAAGVKFGPAIYNATVTTEQGEMQVQMPVFDITFLMANGKTQHRISISPDMVMAMVANMSGWRLALDMEQQQ